jgi:hypothetical protein
MAARQSCCSAAQHDRLVAGRQDRGVTRFAGAGVPSMAIALARPGCIALGKVCTCCERRRLVRCGEFVACPGCDVPPVEPRRGDPRLLR